jgi:hypothetical protein
MNEMNKEQVVNWFLNQSPAFIVFAVFSILLWTQNERAHEENKACNQDIIRIYQSQNERMISALENIEYYIKNSGNGKQKK